MAALRVVVAALLGGLLFWLLWRVLGAQASGPVIGKMQVAAELLDLSFDDGAVPLVRGTYRGFEVEIVPVYPRRFAASSVHVTMKEIGGLGELITEEISLLRADGNAIANFVRGTADRSERRRRAATERDAPPPSSEAPGEDLPASEDPGPVESPRSEERT